MHKVYPLIRSRRPARLGARRFPTRLGVCFEPTGGAHAAMPGACFTAGARAALQFFCCCWPQLCGDWPMTFAFMMSPASVAVSALAACSGVMSAVAPCWLADLCKRFCSMFHCAGPYVFWYHAPYAAFCHGVMAAKSEYDCG